jgi:ATPase family protein associated with various cellular activities (AAA)
VYRPHMLAQTKPASVHDLRTLVLSRHAGIYVDTAEEERASLLITAVANEVHLPIYDWTITKGLGPAGHPSGLHGSAEPAKALANLAEVSQEALFVLYDFVRHLGDAALSRAFRDLLERFSSPARMSTILLVGTGAALPPEIRPHVITYELKPPTRDDYKVVVAAVAESLMATGRAKVTLQPADHDAVAGSLGGLTVNEARQLLARVAIEDGLLDASDLSRVHALKAEALRDDGLLEFFPAQDNPTELGGFAKLRDWLERAAMARSPEAAAMNLPAPGGLLLVGVQGCGKSLAAKFVARAWQLPILKLDAARLYDKYVGETERNLRRAIATAESLAPVVLWLDEVEKALAPSGDTDGGVSQRLLGSFLTWLQEKRADVFVVATANDLSKLPPELLRKGRFDEIFFVDLPTAPEREQILRIHLGLRKVDPSTFDIGALAAASDGFSGAEIEQAVIAGALRSLQAKRDFDTSVLLEELKGTVPLSRSRAEEVQALREWARGRFVPVS